MFDPRILVALAAGGLLASTLSGCGSRDADARISPLLSQQLSAHELATAQRVAMTRVRAEHATIDLATATVSKGRVPAGRAIHHRACSSGRLLQITLRGEFPRTSTAQVIGDSGVRVHGEALTVDATTGTVCGDSFIAGSVLPDPTAAILFSG
jgi:hypothetical protein